MNVLTTSQVFGDIASTIRIAWDDAVQARRLALAGEADEAHALLFGARPQQGSWAYTADSARGIARRLEASEITKTNGLDEYGSSIKDSVIAAANSGHTLSRAMQEAGPDAASALAVTQAREAVHSHYRQLQEVLLTTSRQADNLATRGW